MQPSLFIEPEELQNRLDDERLLILDVGKASLYQQLHIPGAIFVDYGDLVSKSGDVSGLLPPVHQLERLFSSLGISDGSLVVTYDDEGGGKAARLIWTLHCLGFNNALLLNGGIHAWANEGFPLSREIRSTRQSDFRAKPDFSPIADAESIAASLDDPDVQTIDARSADEYFGRRLFARRGGHIPGAVHWEWTAAMDQRRNLRLRPEADLRAELAQRNIHDGQTLICYCQTHHRSSFLYVLLKHLGFDKVQGYPGSWSDWGNRNDLPVE